MPDTEFVKGWTETRCLAQEVSRADIARYAGASGDVNLVHVDEPAAVAAGYGTVLAHGMLTMGLTATFVETLVEPAALRRFGGRFVAPVHAGDSLDCRLTITSVATSELGTEVVLHVRTTKGDDVPVFVGEAVAVIAEGPRS